MGGVGGFISNGRGTEFSFRLVYSNGDVWESGWYEDLLRRCFSSLGGEGDGEAEGEGWVIQLLSISEGAADWGRVEVAIVLMVLDE